MQKRWLVLVILAAIIAVSASARPLNIERSLWLPQNLYAHSVIERIGGGHDGYRYFTLGGQDDARRTINWLRVSELIKPANAWVRTNVSRELAYANAALGNREAATLYIQRAARSHNIGGYYDPVMAGFDWGTAISYTYDTHGIEAAEIILAEAEREMERHEGLRAAAIEDGYWFEGLDSGEEWSLREPVPDWWTERLMGNQISAADYWRIYLVERLLGDGEIDLAGERLRTLENSGLVGLELTLAQAWYHALRARSGGSRESLVEFADLLQPFIRQIAAAPREGKFRQLDDMHTLRRGALVLNEVGRCDDLSSIIGTQVEQFDAFDEAELTGDFSRHSAWYALDDQCSVTSWRGGDRADELCDLRDRIWHEEVENDTRAYPHGGLPAQLPERPEPFSCFAVE